MKNDSDFFDDCPLCRMLAGLDPAPPGLSSVEIAAPRTPEARTVRAHLAANGATPRFEIEGEVEGLGGIEVVVAECPGLPGRWLVATAGLARIRLRRPDPTGTGEPRRIEYAMVLPPEWAPGRGRAATTGDAAVECLMELAGLAALRRRHIGQDHFLGFSDSPVIPGLPYRGLLAGAPEALPKRLGRFQPEGGRRVALLFLTPLLPAEAKFAMERSGREMRRRLRQAGVAEPIDPLRPPVV